MQHEVSAEHEAGSMGAGTAERRAPGLPFVSILMPAFNAEDTIQASIASVQAQERTNWELIIVDDGSTDRTLELAREAAADDPRIIVVAQENQGCGFARNTAAAHATAEFLALLDADDEYLPNYLTRMLALTERYPDRDVYSCNGYFVFPNGVRVPVRKGRAWAREREATAHEMIESSVIFIVAVLRRSAFERVGGFRRRVVEDFDFWTRILITGGRHIYTPERLALYNLTPGSISTSQDGMQRARLEVMETLAEEYPQIRGARYDAAHAAQERRMEFAALERRMVEGDTRGARRGFFSAWPVHRTRARKYVGGATMLVHPSLYRKVFLGRLYPPDGQGKS